MTLQGCCQKSKAQALRRSLRTLRAEGFSAGLGSRVLGWGGMIAAVGSFVKPQVRAVRTRVLQLCGAVARSYVEKFSDRSGNAVACFGADEEARGWICALVSIASCRGGVIFVGETRVLVATWTLPTRL